MILELLANGLSTFPIKGNPQFNNGPKILPKKSCAILFNWIFDNFTSAEELFAKAIPKFGTCVLVNNNLREKVSSPLESPTTFDKIFKFTSVSFYVYIDTFKLFILILL